MAEACAVCGGTKKEHEGRQHAFTTTPGDLKTPDKPQQQAPQPTMVRLGGAPTNEAQAMNRLLEVLLHKGTISSGEALYIATGVHSEGIPAIIHRDGRMTLG